MNSNDIHSVFEKQKKYFHDGRTLPVAERVTWLKQLRATLNRFEQEILDALRMDLGKSNFEAFSNEIGTCHAEINDAIRSVKRWAKPKRVPLELYHQPGSGTLYPEPYGVVLVIAPWNYPFQLAINPIVAALAAGNTVILKPSELSTATEALLVRLISSTFPPELVSVITGGPEVVTALLSLPLDKIFFTGSVPVGKIIMAEAAKNLTPITLELGGKSPTLVDCTAKIELAARKIAWGKFNNAGQTCVAPDYLLVHESIHDRFVQALKTAIDEFFGSDPSRSEYYGRIINERHAQRLVKLIDAKYCTVGGNYDTSKCYIAPTVLTGITTDHPSMEDEIFGPILPILRYSTLEEAIELVRHFPKPLALYLFTEDPKIEHQVLSRLSFGGGCINTTLLHTASAHLPFGGVGQSGMGAYHGKAGFDCFSHIKPILRQSTLWESKLAYPGSKLPLGLLKWLMKQ